MNDKHPYRILEEKHVKELEEWFEQNLNIKNQFEKYYERTIEEYCNEYSYKFAIPAIIAWDLNYPRASQMMNEYKEFDNMQDFFD